MKVFLLAAFALTLMMSLGSILRPVQEYGVGPRQVVHLMGYFLPIMLTFVLPMAALFAASLVYGRFAADNELDACRASGISMLTLISPGFALAIIVAIANLVLSFYVMPVFVMRAEKSLKADAKQMLFRNIQRRGYCGLPPDEHYKIYADQVIPQNDALKGVIVVELENYKIGKIITAESAKVHFNPHDRFSEVQITAHNTYQMGSETEGGFFTEWISLTTEFGSMLGDDIKFKKIDEMKKIRIDPMRFYPITKLAAQTYAQFTTEMLAENITEKISRGSGSFYKLHSGSEFVEFTASRCAAREEKQIELSGQVEAIVSDVSGQRPSLILRAERALLHLEGDEMAPTLTMEIYSPAWKQSGGSEGLAQRHVIRGLILPQALTNKFQNTDVLEIMKPNSMSLLLKNGPSLQLKGFQKRLFDKVTRTMAEINSEINSRLVFGTGCIIVIMIGIALGIIKKGGHLLGAFGASSVPAAVLIVCIMMGKNVATNPGAKACSGIMLMWSSLVILFLSAMLMYRRLLKN
jgi:lipopolysaccharide export LptBFGC system permease protein LptF